MNNLEVLKSGIEGFGLEASDKKLQNLKKYREILVEWNKVMNLTAITEYEDVINDITVVLEGNMEELVKTIK